MVDAAANSPPVAKLMPLHGWLLLVWFAASFGLVFFAHDLMQVVAGGPLSYWFAAQGSVIIFIGIVAVFAWFANRQAGQELPISAAFQAYNQRIHRRFATFVVLLIVFILVLALAEQGGLRKIWVGAIFLFATVFLYALIGIYGRTSR